jgi:hypothetical protein
MPKKKKVEGEEDDSAVIAQSEELDARPDVETVEDKEEDADELDTEEEEEDRESEEIEDREDEKSPG